MSARTSASHPLLISELEAGRGTIGITICPGKRQVGATGGDWDRSLDADLDRVRAWGAALVVTAVEPFELVRLEVPALGDEIEARGIEWHHVPIRDFSVPGVAAEARWFWASARVHRTLARGGRVLLHCKGGLGRGGLLAARVLIELGTPAEQAIREVRAARRGAIETEPQERYLQALDPGARSQAPDDAPSHAERVLGCLLGGAVGDGFGYAVEFSSLAEIRSWYGPEGLREPVLERGRLVVSDDTQMTMFTVEGLIRALQHGAWDRPGEAAFAYPGGAVRAAVWRAYLRWLETQGESPKPAPGSRGWLVDEPTLRQRRAPGNTCLSALRRGQPGRPGHPPNDSKGCGGAMRTAPVGLLPTLDPREAYRLGHDLALLTHGHPAGAGAAGRVAAFVRRLATAAPERLEPAALIALLRKSQTEDTDMADGDVSRAAVDAALAAAERGERDRPAGGLGQGWVAEEAIAIALWAFLIGRDFPDTVQLGANHDGDSDSTASIAGQFYGACRGVAAIPAPWARRLDVLEPLLVLAHDLAEVGSAASERRSPRLLREYPDD